MAATSMIKEYLKRQLRYWVDNFKDEQLPRDFNAKGFNRPQLTLTKIALKPDKLASLLQLPPPLVVTRATCSELVLRVPSWHAPDKLVQEPLRLALGDVFVDVRRLDECDARLRDDVLRRRRSSAMEPDPLGSIASMYQFATLLHERLEVAIASLAVKVYARQRLRVRLELTDVHARTTNALWQDMRDLTHCVDRSPDGLLQTRFKYVSMRASLHVHPATPASTATTTTTTTTTTTGTADPIAATAEGPGIRLLHDHVIALRVTQFGHRRSRAEAWDDPALSRVVDLNLETLPFDLTVQQLQDIYETLRAMMAWLGGEHDGRASVSWSSATEPATTLSPSPSSSPSSPLQSPRSDDPQQRRASSSATTITGDDYAVYHHHQVDRRPRSPAHVTRNGSHPEDREDEDGGDGDPPSGGFALQVTVRFTAHALIRFASERRGELQLAVIAQNAAFNWIVHHHGARELQVTVNDVNIRHKDKNLFHLKPGRDALLFRRDHDGIFLKWQLQRIACQLENDIAIIVNELYHSFNEIEQAAVITCGTCHHKIHLEAIASHVCAPPRSAPTSPTAATASGKRKNSAATAGPSGSTSTSPSTTSADDAESIAQWNSETFPKLRVVLAVDEVELIADSNLFRSVQDLIRARAGQASMPSTTQRSYSINMRDCNMSTESKEFVGDAIFVPVLPLAFQMLECTIRGCGCVQRQQEAHKKNQPRKSQCSSPSTMLESDTNSSSTRPRPRYPDRLFAEVAHLSLKSTDLASKQTTFASADKLSFRGSYSDGVKVCKNCHPQMSSYFHVERIRCQLEHHVYDAIQKYTRQLPEPVVGRDPVDMLTLFLAVMEIRNVELTLMEQQSGNARFKGQFRHVGAVVDNQLGHLSLQTNFDFKSLLNSSAVRYTHDPSELVDSTNAEAQMSRRERLRQREHRVREESATRIQASLRRFIGIRRFQLDKHMRQLTNEGRDNEVDGVGPRHASGHSSQGPPDNATQSESKVNSAFSSADGAGKRPPAQGLPSLFSSPEDLVNPMKMVAAASVFKDGLTKYVKAKQHMLESEMTELAMHSKESAVRLLPKYSAMKNLLSPKAGGIVTDITNAEIDGTSANTVRPTEAPVSNLPVEVEERPDEDGQTPVSVDLSEPHEVHVTEEENDHSVEATSADAEDIEQVDEKLNAHETVLAGLPLVVRIMVQVEEHRMCVPISPRASVDDLCKDIVRRFNEMFAHSGFITNVTLQNPHGGVFAASDIVGLIYTAENELFFAYPHDDDGAVRSLVHINPTDAMHSPTKKTGGSKTSSFSSQNGGRAIGRRFTRCSKLPLPLVVALLANESERDLLGYIMRSGNYGRAGGGNAEEWPELAINSSFLDPLNDMLQVEVRWFGQCLEVTNVDAFLLCLQQLGLCTSRANSKHIGKVLRDRLKMDRKNPLVAAAAACSPDFQSPPIASTEDTTEESGASGSGGATMDEVTYNSLKEIVQEEFGVYVRRREA